MRVGVLIRSWLSGLVSFLAVTTAFCVALVVAITGPPSWGELRGVGDNISAAFSQIGAFTNRQIEAYQQGRQSAEPVSEPQRAEAPQLESPHVTAPASEQAAPAPQTSDADDLAGGADEPALPGMRAPPASRAELARRSERPPQPRPLASRPPAQAVEIAPPVEPAVERPSITNQLMQAVEALIPSLEVSEEAPKPVVKDSEPLPDPYLDAPYADPASAEARTSDHAEARRRARIWTPHPDDRFPADERDLERWGQN